MSVTEKPSLSDLYAETDYLNWDINPGNKKVHARQVSGRYRTRQWLSFAVLYGGFFLLPYLMWNSRQAILFDIPAQKFYLLGVVLWPQDLWTLALFLFLCFVLLMAMTALSGRIFCGFVCPQTAWVSFLVWIENWIEGPPNQRYKLDSGPWSIDKITKKLTKHMLWILVCSVTSITFIGYFSGIYESWLRFFSLTYNVYEWSTFAGVTTLFYVNSGFLREQVCMWICPYARLQGVFTDLGTRVVTYDHARGEPRGKLKHARERSGSGDCIDCNLCVTVCPTGIDIRKGQQLGCINCGFCIDACDDVMQRVDKPAGLIRIGAQHEFDKKDSGSAAPRPVARLIYAGITLVTLTALIVATSLRSEVALNVQHERNPLYTVMSDGSIQNIYHLNFLNKTEQNDRFVLNIEGLDHYEAQLINHSLSEIVLRSGEIKEYTLHVRTPEDAHHPERRAFRLTLQSLSSPKVSARYDTMFIGPKT